MATKIEWTDETWNPITGCSPASIGCKNCYAKRMARRLAGRHGYPEAPHHFDVTFHPDRLEQPLKWKKPRKIFVCSMSDLFHEDVPNEWRDQVFAVLGMTQRHTHQLLTKRPSNALSYFTTPGRFRRVYDVAYKMAANGFFGDSAKRRAKRIRIEDTKDSVWTKVFANVWIGVTAENQEQADKRIPILLQIPAAVRFVSIEPMLGPMELHSVPQCAQHCEKCDDWLCNGPDTKRAALDWVIVGAETGPGARKMDLNWACSIRDQCQAAGVPFFFKKDSDGNHELDGRVWEEFPE